jgi:SAM-dependent methyltransferase
MIPESSVVERPMRKVVDCPACRSANWQRIEGAKCPGYVICRCQNCDLVFSDPMVAADAEWYSSSWLYGMRESHTQSTDALDEIPWNFTQALQELSGTRQASLLDVGCAEGFFLYLAQRAGYDVTGVDFNPVSLEIARKRLGVSTIYQYSVAEMGERFPQVRFDVATMFEVLEHTANPCETLRSIHTLLNPNGKLCISVPGSQRWPQWFHPEVDTPPHHLTLWTEKALRTILQRAGFRVVCIRKRPLEAQDLGFHMKLRLYATLRKWRTVGVRSGNNRSCTAPTAASGRSRIFRKTAIALLQPLRWALALNPNAGGFTLFALCEKE